MRIVRETASAEQYQLQVDRYQMGITGRLPVSGCMPSAERGARFFQDRSICA